jgi:flagellar biosynthesis/type III secretory pathway protein FliH
VASEFSFETLEAPAGLQQLQPVAAADDLLSAARAEADMMREQSRLEGLEQGRAEALAELGPALELMQNAALALQSEQLAAAERLEAHAVDLAMFLAEKVVQGAIAVEPSLVVEAVRGALRSIVERERVTVLVHPADLETVRRAMDDVRANLGGVEHCEVQAERRVSRGGAVVRTPDGDVDARMETKLKRAREVVEEALRA